MALDLLGAATSLVGDLFSQSGQNSANAQNMAIAQMNNQFNAQQAQLTRDWETQMSDTAMQRRVKDLRAAGLNPVLAANTPGASTPTASSAQGNMTSMQNAKAAFGQLGNQINQSLITSAQVANTNADTELKGAQAAQARANTLAPGQAQAASQAGTAASVASAQQASAQADSLRKQLDVQAANIDALKAQAAAAAAQAKKGNVDAQTAKMLQQALVDKAKAEAQLASLGVPKAKVEAGLSTQAAQLLGQGPQSWPAQTGEWIATHVHDIADALGEWWHNAVKASHNPNWDKARK